MTTRNLLWILIAVSALAGIYFCSYERAWLHPHFFADNMPRLIPDSLGFRWRDLLLPFGIFDGQEARPRFIAYHWLLVEHHLRLWAYQYVLIPPTISLAWPLEIYAAYLLYRVVFKLTGDKNSGLISVAVYISSVGFLSGFGIDFMPGKPLSHVVLIGAIYLAMQERLTAMAWLIFAGCFLDETALIVPFVIFAMYPKREMAWRLALPVVGFMYIALLGAPLITKFVFNYRFNFVDTALNGGSDNLSLEMFARNVLALFGSATVPYPLADPATTLWPYAVGLALFIPFLWLADRKVWLATGVFLVMFSLLMSRHGGWAYGFYYGSIFSVFLALLMGTAYRGRAVILGLTVFVVGMQLTNFYTVQEKWAVVHDEISNKVYYNNKALPQRSNMAELSAIHQAFLSGKLEVYLADNPPSSGALYLVAELRQLQKIMPSQQARVAD